MNQAQVSPADDALRRVAVHLAVLGRREGRLAWLRGALGVLVVLLVGWCAAMGLAWAQEAQGGGAVALGVIGVLAAAAVVGWSAQAASQARDPLRQADVVEAARPELRGRLRTVAERLAGPQGKESAGLLGLAATKAAVVVAGVSPEQVHHLRSLRRAGGAAASAGLAWLVLAALAPLGPWGSLVWLVGGSPAVAGPAPDPDATPETAVVGDVVLRYEFPAYTGLEPLVVENSDGTAHGPPGTRVTVTVRTDRPVEGAWLQVDETPATAAEVLEPRRVQGAFTILRDGTWRALLMRGGQAEASRRHAIKVDPDNPPLVEVRSPSDRLEVAVDQQLPLSWTARDDYGLSKVTVVVESGGEVLLREVTDGARLLDGTTPTTPRDLGLEPGDDVRVTVAAWDTDEVSGPKVGRGRSVRLVVQGAKAQSRRTQTLWRELRDALVDVAADFVVDPRPGPVEQREVARWAALSAARFDPVDQLVERYWDVFAGASLEKVLVDDVKRRAASLFGFVQSVADPRQEGELRPTDLETVGTLRQELLENMEQGILLLDKLLYYQALGQLSGQLEALALAGREASDRAGSEARPATLPELRGRLGAIERQALAARQTAEDLHEGPLRDLVGFGLDDAGRVQERAAEALDGGRQDEAGERLDELASTLERLDRDVRNRQQQVEQEGEDLQRRIEDIMKRLEELEKGERALADQVGEARRRTLGEDGGADLWARAEALAGQVAEGTGSVASAVRDEAWQTTYEREWTGGAAEQAERLLRAVRGRDLERSRAEADRAQLRLERASSLLASYGNATRNAGHRQALEQAERRTVELRRLLDELDRSANRATPELRQEAARLSTQQQGLSDETQGVQGDAGQLMQAMPMAVPGLEEGLEGALYEMERTSQALDRARAAEGEGAAQAAADRLQQALQSLEQAAGAMEQMQRAMEGGEQPGDSRGDEGAEARSDPEVEIPPPERFMTPDEYWQALLRGMEGEVPPEYEALKKRYYEELVRQ